LFSTDQLVLKANDWSLLFQQGNNEHYYLSSRPERAIHYCNGYLIHIRASCIFFEGCLAVTIHLSSLSLSRTFLQAVYCIKFNVQVSSWIFMMY